MLPNPNNPFSGRKPNNPSNFTQKSIIQIITKVASGLFHTFNFYHTGGVDNFGIPRPDAHMYYPKRIMTSIKQQVANLQGRKIVFRRNFETMPYLL
jgi:hypothetical protein